MPDYRIKISETQDEEREYHHYLVTAKDEEEAKMFAMKFMKRFIDDDNDPDLIENGYTFYNNEVFIRLESIKETTKEKFKEFLLKIHTINMKWNNRQFFIIIQKHPGWTNLWQDIAFVVWKYKKTVLYAYELMGINGHNLSAWFGDFYNFINVPFLSCWLPAGEKMLNTSL